MEIRDTRVLILGGSGLVGLAIAREMLRCEPARLTITALTREEADAGLAELEGHAAGTRTEIASLWGDLMVAEEFKDRPRRDLIESGEKRSRLLDDIYGAFNQERLERSFLYRLLIEERPQIVIDCVNTATAIAYQDVFSSVERLRTALAEGRDVSELLERHLAIIYMPQLIRHVHILLEALREARTEYYLKVGTSGTGGMGLNIPFTHSEQRPSSMLLAKSSVAGAHSLLLFLMARTPGAPAVKEIKPTAAIAWKRIGAGPISWRGRPYARYDALRAVPFGEALDDDAGAWKRLDGQVESVYIDMGENGLFSRDEFEALSTLGLMELVTAEEIALTVIREIRGQPTGLDIVSALDGAAMGPTYRGGVLRELALRRMEELERARACRSVAFEMLGPPRLSKLLIEAHLLERLLGTWRAGAELDPGRTAERAEGLIREDERLRVDVLSIGLPILSADGARVLRGPELKVRPDDGGRVDDRLIARGWVDLRPSNWEAWRKRIRAYLAELSEAPGPDDGSSADIDLEARAERIRPGAAAAWIFKREDGGERVKR